jgi:CheY-like chemotaxis protein
MLVDDEASVRKAGQMLLEVEGYRVTAVASVYEALQKTGRDGGIDLVVSDYHLVGGETGIDVISALRGRLGLPIPAVLLTGDTSSAIQGLSKYPDLRIASKPIDADELFGLMDMLLGSRAG